MEAVMGLLDAVLGEVLKNAIGGNASPQQQTQLPDIFSSILKDGGFGGVGGILKQLAENGLKHQVDSWLGNGQNLPVNPSQINDALGNDQIRQIAKQFGIPIDALLPMLAKYFPGVVDKMSPDGVLVESMGKGGG